MTLIEFSLLSMLATYNSPFEKRPTLLPSMSVELRPASFVYIKQTDEARCTPDSPNIWHPIQVRWSAEAGLIVAHETLRLGVGHTSQHGVDGIVSSSESFDYLRVDYRMELH